MVKTIRTAAMAMMCLSFLAPTAALAATEADKEMYVFGLGGLVEPDDDRVTGRGVRADLGFGMQIAPKWYLEATAAGTILNGPLASRDLYTAAALANLQWLPYERGVRWAPFVDAALGLVKNEDVGVELQGGLGLLSPSYTSAMVRGRAQLRAVYDDAADGALDYVVSAGIEIPIGVTRTFVQTVEVEKIVEKVVEKPVAAVDSDGDGVIDSIDRCPGTLRGALVDATGCSTGGQALTLERVQFASGSDELTPASYPALNEAVAAMKGQPAMRVKLKGHTDSTGSSEANLRLSQQRAEAVGRRWRGAMRRNLSDAFHS